MSNERRDARTTAGKNDQIADAAYARALVPKRPFGAHKWGVGGLVIVGGAPGYVGAPMLAAMAAQRAGAGIVNLAVPRSLIGTIAGVVPEVSFTPLSETESVQGARRAAEAIGSKLEKAKALVLGPGLGQDEASGGLMGALLGSTAATPGIGFSGRASATAADRATGLLSNLDQPILIDADGLNWLAEQPDWPLLLPPGCVLTPHVGELSRLTGMSADEITEDPLSAAKDAAARWKQTVVLKYGYAVATDGAIAVIADDAPVSLATAGTGDVLAGTIGAFLAQGLAPLDAAGLALHVGCAAARICEERTGVLGLVAGDLPLAIAAVLHRLARSEGE